MFLLDIIFFLPTNLNLLLRSLMRTLVKLASSDLKDVVSVIGVLILVLFTATC